MTKPARVVVCTVGGERNPWHLPASSFVERLWIGGGERSLHELATAIAATGRTVELRGMVHRPTLDELSAAAGARPLVGLDARRPAADDLVIVPEGWAEPLSYARLALSPARTVLLMLAPPGLFGWPFVSGWSPPSPLTVDFDRLARPEHFRAMAGLGFELWTSSRGIAEAARAAGVPCTWIGSGHPAPVAEPVEQTIDVVWLEDNRWAPLAREVATRVEVSHRAIPPSNHAELLRQLGAGRVLLWPSRVEGSARIPTEARALGTVPVALTTNPYATGLDEQGGCVVVDSVEELPPAIHALLADPDRLAELSARAIRTAREQIDWPAYVGRVEAALARPAPLDPDRDGRAAIGSELDALLAQRDHLLSQVAALRQGAEEKDELIADVSFHLLAAQRTVGWKTLERFRRVRDRLLPPGSRRRQAYWAARRVVEVLLDEGPRALFRKTGHKIRQALTRQGVLVKSLPQEIPQDLDAQYQVWLQRHRLTRQDIARIKAAVDTFRYAPLISIVTPVYNTDETWLRKAVESVRDQIYPRWELCLVNDTSTTAHVRSVLDEYAAADPRVRVKHLPRNQGVAGASTHALSLATGEFVGFLDHDDELPPDALFEVVKRLNEDPDLDLLYSDEDKLEPDGSRVDPFFKPDWSPNLLLSMNYITHFSVFRRSLLGEIGGFRGGLDGSQDYDLLLRFTEHTDKIAHIPKILYHWRKAPGSAAASNAAKSSAYNAGRRAIEDTLRRRGYEGRVESTMPGRYTVRYRLRGTPLVSIIIPTRDQRQLLQQCLRTVEEKTSYPRYEIIVLDNDSTEPQTLKYLAAIAGKWRVYRYPGPFNFSAINNFGAAQASGDYFLFLNNDIQVIRSDWLTAMLELAQQPEIGAVGAKLLYPDGRVQHAGVILGIGGVAGHAFKYSPGDAQRYFSMSDVVRNCSAVTAACMMVRRRVFKEVGGFDERFRVAYNDVDFCLRLRQRGHLIVYTPVALLYHHESATRGRRHPSEDEDLCWKVWGDLIRAGDPYYNPNLTLSRENWSLRL